MRVPENHSLDCSRKGITAMDPGRCDVDVTDARNGRRGLPGLVMWPTVTALRPGRAITVQPEKHLTAARTHHTRESHDFARHSVHDCSTDGGSGRRLYGVVRCMVESGLAQPARSPSGRTGSPGYEGWGTNRLARPHGWLASLGRDRSLRTNRVVRLLLRFVCALKVGG